ncbi:MAG: protein kinase [Planctomycetes bacterium]|nr:protein kinase [Planctomycetota bacterium]
MSAPQPPSDDPVTLDPRPAGGGQPSAPSGGSSYLSGAPSTNPLQQSHLTSSSTDSSRFASGTILADRYRIVSRLGKGGMGEVYRADDLKLGTSVALKFLPDSFVADPLKLDRFRSEVRLTREISHPNVCRVYDFGEIDNASGHHVFLSMEYVDGEDLSILLKRIGRLPEDKAVQIARQVCSGLHAAHELGVIHRDLKPANIMLDGRGNARIMDFGVAGVLSDLVAKGDVASGTPAYMAPEQLARQGVSKRSDIYSLGLVLYELFTGHPAFQVESMQQLRASRESGTRPTNPSDHVKTLDPVVETVILRCLEVDPAKRPGSAIAVAAALPGGDPLAAALAAGETPSPELVALAGAEGSIPARLAWSLVAVVVCMVGALGFIQDRYGIHRIAPFEYPTDAMAVRARDMLRKLDPDAPTMFEAFGYNADRASISASAKIGGFSKLNERFPPAIYFWLRAEPQWIRPIALGQLFISPDSPSRELPESAYIALSSSGDLIRFERRAPELGFRGILNDLDSNAKPPSPPLPPNWAPFFEAAGLDIAKFSPATPTIAHRVSADTRYAWRGAYPDRPDVPVQIEAASLDGYPVSFRTKSLWRLGAVAQPAAPEDPASPSSADPDEETRAPATASNEAARNERAASSTTSPRATPQSPARFSIPEILGGIVNIVLTVGIISAGVLGWKNTRSNRGDRRGAFVLGVFIGGLTLISLAIGRHTIRHMLDFQIIATPLARALWLGGLTWLVYLGMEPVVRRRWPNFLISWTRLLSGRTRDPLVWRDILIGCTVGAVFGPVYALSLLIDIQPFHVADPVIPNFTWFSGFTFSVAILLQTICGNLAIPLLITLLLVGLDRIVRSPWIAYPLAGAFLWLVIGGETETAVSLAAALCAAVCMLVLRFFGQLAFAVALMTATILVNFPISVDLTSWYAPLTLVGSVPLIVLAAAGAYFSGRPGPVRASA